MHCWTYFFDVTLACEGNAIKIELHVAILIQMCYIEDFFCNSK